MLNPSLYSLFSEQSQTAYSTLLDRPENNPSTGDVGASIRWPSPLYATPEHRAVARITGTPYQLHKWPQAKRCELPPDFRQLELPGHLIKFPLALRIASADTSSVGLGINILAAKEGVDGRDTRLRRGHDVADA